MPEPLNVDGKSTSELLKKMHPKLNIEVVPTLLETL